MSLTKSQNTLFEWTARTSTGARRKGVTEAADKKALAETLRIDGLYPIGIEAVGGASPNSRSKTATRPKALSIALGKKLSMAEADMLMGRLAKLIGMGISLDRALGFIEDAPNAKGRSLRVAAAAGTLRKVTREGTPLSDALREQVGWDDVASLTLIRAAEKSGDLAQALSAVKRLIETRLALLQRLATGLIYPAILIVVACVSVGLVMIAIIPEFRPIVEGRFDMIPWLGRMVFALSAWLEKTWLVLVPVLVAAVGVAIGLQRRGHLAPLASRLAMRLPLLRGLLLRNGMIRSLHVLGVLLSRGVVLSDAISTITQTGRSDELAKAFEAVLHRIEGGDPLWEALADTGLAPPDTIEMVRIGEEAGDLPDMILRSAEDMRASADRDLDRAMLLFQPALIVFVGLLIGVSLYALFSAISAVNSISF